MGEVSSGLGDNPNSLPQRCAGKARDARQSALKRGGAGATQQRQQRGHPCKGRQAADIKAGVVPACSQQSVKAMPLSACDGAALPLPRSIYGQHEAHLPPQPHPPTSQSRRCCHLPHSTPSSLMCYGGGGGGGGEQSEYMSLEDLADVWNPGVYLWFSSQVCVCVCVCVCVRVACVCCA